ncbi:unnamed protein product [Echinostoma caproni]|uniref:Endoplasmic reticulum lectin 1 n=1 Tax=Echinostoma caproni TaxID=27848 RepID=A0A183BH13_9TREM|nr:unnamed protein product [Echinostoma caproni]
MARSMNVILWLVCFNFGLLHHANSLGGSKIDDDSLYKIDWTSRIDGPPLLVSTKLGEKYECDIPLNVKNEKKRDIDESASINELELLNEVFSREPCAVRTEFYWTYELCHKAHIRQYHEEFKPDKTISSRQEYFLGYLDNSDIEIDDDSTRHKKYSYPYYPVNFTMGDICDLTQQHRVTTVLYICFEDIEAQIVEVAEVESCRYQVIFATKHLCRHPAYQVSYCCLRSLIQDVILLLYTWLVYKIHKSRRSVK